jgi:hypothetical protein
MPYNKSMHHTCCSHFPSRKDHLQTPLNSSHTTAILKQKEKKKTPQPPLEKKVPKEFPISLSLCEEEKNWEKFSPSLSRFSHQFSYLIFTKDFEPFRSHSRVFQLLKILHPRSTEEGATHQSANLVHSAAQRNETRDGRQRGPGGCIRTYAYIRSVALTLRTYEWMNPVAHFSSGVVDG